MSSRQATLFDAEPDPWQLDAAHEVLAACVAFTEQPWGPYDYAVPANLAAKLKPGQRVQVPLGDILLRCFQYVFGDRISYGRFCWNNECGNCKIRCLNPGDRREHTVRACMYESREGLTITEVPLEFRVFMEADRKSVV